MTEKFISRVPVATIWYEPTSSRAIDELGIASDPSMSAWLQTMNVEQRHALCHENRVASQLLYGESVEVDEIVGDWAKIRAIKQPYRKFKTGYPGWVPLAQIMKKELHSGDGFIKIIVPRTQLFDEQGLPIIVISFNTVLPVIDEQRDTYTVHTPHGRAQIRKEAVDFAANCDGFTQKDAQNVAYEMLKFLDIPYFWGGMSSYGYDCSGLTYNAMKACGYQIPRDASDQARAGQEVAIDDRPSWKIGDLVFFTTPGKQSVRHVGIYLGNSTLLHTSIVSDKVEVIDLEGHQLNKEITHIRRYIEGA